MSRRCSDVHLTLQTIFHCNQIFPATPRFIYVSHGDSNFRKCFLNISYLCLRLIITSKLELFSSFFFLFFCINFFGIVFKFIKVKSAPGSLIGSIGCFLKLQNRRRVSKIFWRYHRPFLHGLLRRTGITTSCLPFHDEIFLRR